MIPLCAVALSGPRADIYKFDVRPTIVCLSPNKNIFKKIVKWLHLVEYSTWHAYYFGFGRFRLKSILTSQTGNAFVHSAACISSIVLYRWETWVLKTQQRKPLDVYARTPLCNVFDNQKPKPPSLSFMP
jgi:hypothetical protein